MVTRTTPGSVLSTPMDSLPPRSARLSTPRRRSRGDLRPQEVDDVTRRGTGCENLGDALPLQLGSVRRRNRPAQDDEYVLRAVLLQTVEDPRHECHVRPGEDRDPDRVGVLLDRRLDDLLGRLMQTGVDNLHARIS